MTNWHVFESVSQASDSRVRARFRWETGQDGFPRDDYQDVALDPASFFVCGDKTLDYALVALNNLPNGRPPGQKFGHLKLNGLPGKVLTGEPVNIIQHPQKSPKLISCRNSMLVEVDNEITVTYTSDTERGSSGSPVFNDQWQLVAIHARGVQETNSRGEVIDKQGNPIDDNGPEGDRSWVANEGIRVSAIVKHLEGMSLPPKEKRLLGNALRN